MQRLGKNNGGYQGERIDIHEVLRQIEQLAAAGGWQRDALKVSDHLVLKAFRRPSPDSILNLYISSGIHGDEPAGPLAVLKLFQENRWPDNIGIWLVPCLNPGGYTQNRRGNEDGLDLNRDYRSLKAPAVRTHIDWLLRQPRFEVTLLLHEDWESNGFYLYELNPSRERSFAEAIIQRVSRVCPIDTSPEIEGRPAENGIICANPDLMQRPDWPEAFYLIHHKSPVSYTLEAPSDFELSTRVDALVEGVRAVFDAVERQR